MKIFISWSGPRSETLAKALREWFPLVLNYVEPWVSQSDIEAGERWGVEVAKELESSNFGVICVTPENLASPWLLFEAGALAKSMQDGRVIPLLLDIDFKEISGPLAQFQAKKAEQSGIKELVFGLNKLAASPIPDERLQKLFAALWVELESNIAAIPKGKTISRGLRPQGEILEELVSSVRGVEMRIRETIDDGPVSRFSRRSRLHPMMLVRMSRHASARQSDPIFILIAASAFRDAAPWLYEIALEAYKAIKSGKPEAASRAYQEFVASLDMLRDAPFWEELGIDRKLLSMTSDLLHDYGMEQFSDLEKFRPDSLKRVMRASSEGSES